ncbi:MAG TPA: hypothetical protein VF622_06425 [Segetibacter sp.]|jgi:hypothetical protein
MITSTTQVAVTDLMNDFLCVDILPFGLQQESFEFVITGEDKITHRKGHFRAPSVQLRTKHLKAGNYQLQLFLHGEEWEHTNFEINLPGHHSLSKYFEPEMEVE